MRVTISPQGEDHELTFDRPKLAGDQANSATLSEDELLDLWRALTEHFCREMSLHDLLELL